jgi:hypothetical protein
MWFAVLSNQAIPLLGLITQAMWFAAFGGIAIPLLGLMELRTITVDRRPSLRDFAYWIPFIVGPILGAVLALAYELSATELNPILGINIGASAPLILRSLAQAVPPLGD